MTKLALLLALLALPPAPSRYVSDPSNLFEDGREHALNERLARYERETSNQLLVYVDRSVPAGTTLEEMGAEAIRTWAVGQEKKDNGVILFLFVDDRESRIEVGYGLEGVLTDARSKRILVGLREDLRAGDYISAAERGAEQIIATISGPSTPQQEAPPPARPIVQDPWPAEPASEPPPLAPIAGLLIAGGLIAAIVTSARRSAIDTSFGGAADLSTPRDDDDDSSSSSWSASSSSSFTGGGGDGGGGGASDRW